MNTEYRVGQGEKSNGDIEMKERERALSPEIRYDVSNGPGWIFILSHTGKSVQRLNSWT